jgi:hypothetical protein
MATLKHRSRRTVTLLVAGGLTLAGTGVAFAYWTAQGTGTGTATTGESTAFVIEGGTSANPLFPGGPAELVPFTVTNPGDASQVLSTISVYVGTAVDDTWSTEAAGGDTDGCHRADFTVRILDAPSYTAPIAAGATVTGNAEIQMIETGANQDACQNLVGENSVPLYFTTAAQPV